MRVTNDILLRGCDDDSEDAGLRCDQDLKPSAGAGAPVKPAIYANRQYQEDTRWVPGPDGALTRTAVIVLDGVPSQANRLEAALEQRATELGLPRVILDVSAAGDLPPHLPSEISGFRFPHRQADAYLRDAMLDGSRFSQTEVGRPLFRATADQPEALYQWFPQALLFGFWQSHLGRCGSQAKLARAWVSELVGIDPGTGEGPDQRTRTLGVKGDPLNLSIDERVQFEEGNPATWKLEEGTARSAGAGRKRERLSEIGHGQVPFRSGEEALAGVSFRAITQRATVSFAALRRVGGPDPAARAAGRALLVALGLVAHVCAFGRPFSLRSGCDLRPASVRWTWLGASGDEPVEPLGLTEAVELFRGTVDGAAQAGLPVGPAWRELRLVPTPELVKAIRATYPPEKNDQ